MNTIMNDTSTPRLFDLTDIPNDTSTWDERTRNSVLSIRVTTTVTRKLREPQLAPFTPIELPEVDTMRSTMLFASHAGDTDRMTEWAKTFGNRDQITRDTIDDRGRAVDVVRRVRIQQALVRAYDPEQGPDTARQRWIEVNLTPARLLDLVDDASIARSPSLTSPSHGSIPLDLTRIHRALVVVGADAVLNDEAAKTLVHDSCLDPLAPIHLHGWDRRREVRPDFSPSPTQE